MGNIAHTHNKSNDFALNLESLGIEFVGHFHATIKQYIGTSGRL